MRASAALSTTCCDCNIYLIRLRFLAEPALELAVLVNLRYDLAMLYFDHNATTPLLPEARQAWLEVSDKFIGNPSSPHRVGARADMVLQAARAKLAAFLDCDPIDIVWTSGATESNNMV